MKRKSNIWRCGPLDLNRYALCKYCNTDSVYKNGFYYSRAGKKLLKNLNTIIVSSLGKINYN